MAYFDREAPPAMLLPPMDLAHDIYALGTQIKGFDHATYQDIQHDQVVYDSFQRWPYLFSLVMSDQEEEK